MVTDVMWRPVLVVCFAVLTTPSVRAEFPANLEAIRDSVIEAELAEGFGPRPNDEFRNWLDRRYGKDNKLIRTSSLTA